MKKVIIATALVMSSMSSAFAVTAESGVYVGAQGGWSFADYATASAQQTGASSNKKNNYTWGGTLGYNYAFTPNWSGGLEVSYLNFGQNNYNNVVLNPGLLGSPVGNVNIRTSGVQIMATGSYLMPSGFNVFGKAGAIAEETRTGSIAGVSVSPLPNNNAKVTKWLPALAAGMGYMPTQNLNIALQYEHTFGADWNNNSGWQNDSITKPISQNAVTLGLNYTFPLSF